MFNKDVKVLLHEAELVGTSSFNNALSIYIVGRLKKLHHNNMVGAERQYIACIKDSKFNAALMVLLIG